MNWRIVLIVVIIVSPVFSGPTTPQGAALRRPNGQVLAVRIIRDATSEIERSDARAKLPIREWLCIRALPHVVHCRKFGFVLCFR